MEGIYLYYNGIEIMAEMIYDLLDRNPSKDFLPQVRTLPNKKESLINKEPPIGAHQGLWKSLQS